MNAPIRHVNAAPRVFMPRAYLHFPEPHFLEKRAMNPEDRPTISLGPVGSFLVLALAGTAMIVLLGIAASDGKKIARAA